MVKVCPLVLVFVSAIQIRGTNIMLNKPTVQSSTWSSDYLPSFANDGSKNNRLSHTRREQDPHWQGDLLGFYVVHRIAVTGAVNGQAPHLRKAFIGVSVHDVSCTDGEVTTCGQWPDADLPEQTLLFNCSHAGPVRFIRIWRDVMSDELAISEVEVTGDPTRLPGAVYDKIMLKKVSTPITSLAVSSVTGCGTMCHRTQPCLAFSYSPFLQPNCLLATDTAMKSDVQWVGYKIQKFFSRPTCNRSGFLW